jgi:hypothetical protein
MISFVYVLLSNHLWAEERFTLPKQEYADSAHEMRGARHPVKAESGIREASGWVKGRDRVRLRAVE